MLDDRRSCRRRRADRFNNRIARHLDRNGESARTGDAPDIDRAKMTENDKPSIDVDTETGTFIAVLLNSSFSHDHTMRTTQCSH